MGTTPRNEGGGNEGEGNKTADRNYREATQKFVESERGRKAIDQAGDVDEREERDIEQAEDEAFRRRLSKGPWPTPTGRLSSTRSCRPPPN
jgi:hypothetical protein